MDSDEQRIKDAARYWLLRLSLGSPRTEDRERCAAWCAEDPRHAAAYRRYESIWKDTATLEELDSLTLSPPTRVSWRRRVQSSLFEHPWRWAVSACLPFAVIGISLWAFLTPTHYSTGIAEVRTVHLPDGSVITLGARSALEIAFQRHERRVALLSGVAFFSVAKDPSRPFVVFVGDEEVRDLGTKFEIRRGTASMRVSVVEGTVAVMRIPNHVGTAVRKAPPALRLAVNQIPAAEAPIRNGAKIQLAQLASTEPSQEKILTAGQQITTTFAGDIPDPHVMPPGYSTAWRHGRLVYVDTPLKDIIADANRYSHEPIKIADGRIADMRISVTCPSNQIDAMVSALSRSLSLKVERLNNGEILLVPTNPRN